MNRSEATRPTLSTSFFFFFLKSRTKLIICSSYSEFRPHLEWFHWYCSSVSWLILFEETIKLDCNKLPSEQPDINKTPRLILLSWIWLSLSGRDLQIWWKTRAGLLRCFNIIIIIFSESAAGSSCPQSNITINLQLCAFWIKAKSVINDRWSDSVVLRLSSRRISIWMYFHRHVKRHCCDDKLLSDWHTHGIYQVRN